MKTTFALLALLPLQLSIANADQVFSNLGKPMGGYWATSPNLIGTVFHTAGVPVQVHHLTLAQFSGPTGSVVPMLLKVSVIGDDISATELTGEFGDPSVVGQSLGESVTVFVSYVAKEAITLEPNTDYMLAVSGDPSNPTFIEATPDAACDSPLGWTVADEWVEYFGFWVKPYEQERIKFALEGQAMDVSNDPPNVSTASVTTPVLWPPNGKLMPVEIVGITDPDGDDVQVVVTSVEQDEVDSAPNEALVPDSLIAPDGSVWVRAERNSTGNGRVYTINFTATDTHGATSDGVVHVSVPRDLGSNSLSSMRLR